MKQILDYTGEASRWNKDWWLDDGKQDKLQPLGAALSRLLISTRTFSREWEGRFHIVIEVEENTEGG